tara:strand:- start:2122 stop:2310 length:189 start_codon:yes stop_codon:yes gene_type:complete
MDGMKQYFELLVLGPGYLFWVLVKPKIDLYDKRIWATSALIWGLVCIGFYARFQVASHYLSP